MKNSESKIVKIDGHIKLQQTSLLGLGLALGLGFRVRVKNFQEVKNINANLCDECNELKSLSLVFLSVSFV
jgi:hypothetical protein